MLKTIRKKSLVVIGLNSGTSADGLDLAAVKITRRSDKIACDGLSSKTIAYPKSLARLVQQVITEDRIGLDEAVHLDLRLGRFYGEQALLMCRNLRRRGLPADLVASHGQTVRHLPGKIRIDRSKGSGTVQLGHPESIARRSGLLTVADFRQADIAAGGEGAPITSQAMWRLLSDRRQNRLLVNIGGIANYFFMPAGQLSEKLSARDCGPGNSLLDIIAARYFNRRYDRNGRMAARGKISRRLLSMLLADNYLKGKYGPSTGRERFGVRFVDKMIGYASKLRLDKHGVLATATELTAVTIARRIAPLCAEHRLERVYLFGGGVHNAFLVERLQYHLPAVSFFSVDTLGIDGDYLEAVCYAVMGAMTVWSIPANMPHVTGARTEAITGRIIQPPPV